MTAENGAGLSSPRFPIRCTIWRPGREMCDKPAVIAATCTTATCPCPPRDVAICADHRSVWAQIGAGRKNQICRACGQCTDYEVTATRELHEGDLPDPVATEGTA